MTTEIIQPVQPVQPRKWYEIWWDVWSHPGITPFQTMLNEPNHDMTRGFIWVAVTSFIIAIFSGILSNQMLNNLSSTQIPFSIGNTICSVISAPIGAIIGIAISGGIYHLIAKLFAGYGKWSDLVYCLSAVVAPNSLIAGVFVLISFLFTKTPAIMCIPGLLGGALGIYVLVMFVNAIRASENIGIGQAIGTMLIPIIVMGILFACIAAALVPVFNSLINNLPSIQ